MGRLGFWSRIYFNNRTFIHIRSFLLSIHFLWLMYEDVLAATIRHATPILLAALGEVVVQRSGVINIGIEGMMLMGAFVGMLGSLYASVFWPSIAPCVGIVVAGLSGGITAYVFALLTIRLGVDQVVTGTGITLLALGLTEVFYQRLFGYTGSALRVAAFHEFQIPFLSNLPWIGRVLFQHNALVFVTFLLVPCVYFYLFHTNQGLIIRACGEHPNAVDTVGVDVSRLRTLCVLFGGLVSGMAGGYLSLADVPYFTPGMTVGRGFIALAIVIFGKWHPIKACGAALIFGLGESVEVRVQAIGLNIPHQFLLMFPYVLTLLVLAGFVGKSRPPLALGVPYNRE